MKVIALILAGGSGTRLWPLSREDFPKQLISLTGELSLMQETCRRLFSLVKPEEQWVITGRGQYRQVSEQIEALREEVLVAGAGRNLPLADNNAGTLVPWKKQYKSAQAADEESDFIKVLAEPEGKNTAPAIFWAARRCQQRYGDDTVLLVLPSDHLILRADKFIQTLTKGIEQATKGYLVTFGIKPNYPETGYGYIKVEAEKPRLNQPYPVASFVEKPNQVTADKYLAEGNYFWNSGIFAFKVGTLLAEGEHLAPATALPFIKSDPFNESDVAEAYLRSKPLSIDYAVMEGTSRAYVVPSSFGWSDVGSWQSIHRISDQDDQGNVTHGRSLLLDCQDCLVQGGKRLVAAIGLKDVAIVDTPDALLVCPLDQTQRVREIVKRLKEKGAGER